MKKISLILVFAICLCSCAVRPKSTILIHPPDEKGIKKVEIMQQRLGKTTYKDGEVEVGYDSKGTSILEDIMKIYSLKVISED